MRTRVRPLVLLARDLARWNGWRVLSVGHAVEAALGELLVELLVRLVALAARASWHAMALPVPEPARWRKARAFLRRQSSQVREHRGRMHASLRADRGHAEVVLDPDEERVRIACPWDGGGVTIARTDGWAGGVGRLARRLGRLPGVYALESDGRTLEVSGSGVLADHLDEATRLLAEVAACGSRLREQGLLDRPSPYR